MVSFAMPMPAYMPPLSPPRPAPPPFAPPVMKAPPAAPRPRMSASAPATPATTRAPTPAPHAAPACAGKKQRVEVAQEQEGEAMEAQDLGSEAMQAIDAFLETNAKEADASKEVVCRMMAEDAVQDLKGGLEPYLKTTKAKRMPCETVCADFGLYKCDVTVLNTLLYL